MQQMKEEEEKKPGAEISAQKRSQTFLVTAGRGHTPTLTHGAPFSPFTKNPGYDEEDARERERRDIPVRK